LADQAFAQLEFLDKNLSISSKKDMPIEKREIIHFEEKKTIRGIKILLNKHF